MGTIIKVYDHAGFMPHIKPLCYEFSKSIDKKLNWNHWKKTVSALIENGVGKGIVSFNDKNNVTGMLVFMFFPDLITGELNATEMCWYVSPQHRGKTVGIDLLDTMINLATDKKVSNINLTHLAEDNRVGEFYQKKGFKLFEKNYTLKVN